MHDLCDMERKTNDVHQRDTKESPKQAVERIAVTCYILVESVTVRQATSS